MVSLPTLSNQDRELHKEAVLPGHEPVENQTKVWMGTADPGGQFFRHVHLVSVENFCEVWRKKHNGNPRKNLKKASWCHIK